MLQKTKEAEHIQNKGLNWLIKEAASSKLINEYSTLRRSCQFYFESRLSPLLAFIISIIDQYSNLETLAGVIETCGFVYDLWLNILSDENICRIEYADMRSSSGEMSEFRCQSDLVLAGVEFGWYLEESKMLRPRLPFFWLVIEQLNYLDKNLMIQRCGKSTNKETMLVEEYVRSVSQFFENSDIFLAINNSIRDSGEINLVEFVLEAYTEDFVLKNCSINSRKDLEVIIIVIKEKVKAIGKDISGRSLKNGLPLVHYVYDQINEEIGFYLRFTQFERRINEAEFWKNIIKYIRNSMIKEKYFFLHKKI